MIVMRVSFDLSATPEAVERSNPFQTIEHYRNEVPGLVLKIWLKGRESPSTGGVYVWESEQAMDDPPQAGGGLDFATRRFGVTPTVQTFRVSAVADGIAFARLLEREHAAV